MTLAHALSPQGKISSFEFPPSVSQIPKTFPGSVAPNAGAARKITIKMISDDSVMTALPLRQEDLWRVSPN